MWVCDFKKSILWGQNIVWGSKQHYILEGVGELSLLGRVGYVNWSLWLRQIIFDDGHQTKRFSIYITVCNCYIQFIIMLIHNVHYTSKTKISRWNLLMRKCECSDLLWRLFFKRRISAERWEWMRAAVDERKKPKMRYYSHCALLIFAPEYIWEKSSFPYMFSTPMEFFLYPFVELIHWNSHENFYATTCKSRIMKLTDINLYHKYRREISNKQL